MSNQRVAFVLVIRVTATLTVVMVWIIRRPRQNIGGVLFSQNLLWDCLTGWLAVPYILAIVSHKGHLHFGLNYSLCYRSRSVITPVRRA
jgi:hypothetical protein